VVKAVSIIAAALEVGRRRREDAAKGDKIGSSQDVYYLLQ
jgi:DNA repair protein RadC